MVVLVGQVQDAHLDFDVALGKTVAGKKVELPEIVARLIGGKALVGLRVPVGLDLAEKAAGEVVVSEKAQWMQGGLVVDLRYRVPVVPAGWPRIWLL